MATASDNIRVSISIGFPENTKKYALIHYFVTKIKRYNEDMELLSIQGQGAFYTFCIFLICVIAVHIAKLAYIGWHARKKKEPVKEKKPEKESEPVYYLVEKKKKVSSQYKKPKKFKFQK